MILTATLPLGSAEVRKWDSFVDTYKVSSRKLTNFVEFALSSDGRTCALTPHQEDGGIEVDTEREYGGIKYLAGTVLAKMNLKVSKQVPDERIYSALGVGTVLNLGTNILVLFGSQFVGGTLSISENGVSTTGQIRALRQSNVSNIFGSTVVDGTGKPISNSPVEGSSMMTFHHGNKVFKWQTAEGRTDENGVIVQKGRGQHPYKGQLITSEVVLSNTNRALELSVGGVRKKFQVPQTAEICDGAMRIDLSSISPGDAVTIKSDFDEQAITSVKKGLTLVKVGGLTDELIGTDCK